jgi:hypothetical protein
MEKKWNITQIQRIVDNHQFEKVNGIIVDGFSASAIVAVFNALSEENKEKAQSMPIEKFANFCFKQIK